MAEFRVWCTVSVFPFMSTQCSAVPAITPRLLYSRKDAASILTISIRCLDYLIADRKPAHPQNREKSPHTGRRPQVVQHQ